MKKWMLYIGFIFLSLKLIGQSDEVLGYEDYIQMVRTHHPITFQMNLLDEKSDAYELKAKGGFDPSINFSLDNKTFDSKEYWQRIGGYLKVPIWLGPDIKLGYEDNTGDFLNMSELVPDLGLMSWGLSVPVGRGLFFDERRKVVEEAKVIRESNNIKKQQLFNKLMHGASKAYIEWQSNYARREILEESADIARQLYENTVQSFINGDKPAIDTIEALVNYRNRQQGLIQINQELLMSRQRLNNYLWMQGQVPLELEEEIVPDALNDNEWATMTQSIRLDPMSTITSNPQLQMFVLRERQLELDRRLAKENLKPVANVNFSLLTRGDNDNTFINYDFNDYKVGVDFYYPLFTRKERGQLKLTELSLQENSLEAKTATEMLENQILNLIAMEDNMGEQLSIIGENVGDYQELLNAEIEKFSIGESSVFLLNYREFSLLDIRVKQVDTVEKLLKNRLDLMLTTFSWNG
ncbi:MAG: TolC family protein [Saprospiraceae bacterium]|nr:TolC family protein [Saprospiraceae bacterium]